MTHIYLTEKGKTLTGPYDPEYIKLVDSYSIDNFGQIPNAELGKWANLTDDDMCHLAHLNDTDHPFEELAQYIEEHH